MKPKVCFVVQRYGLEVNGGAELHCRQLAEHLLPFCDIDVLTTKAVSYVTWADEYTVDEEEINGVHVIRFGVEKPRVMDEFAQINARFVGGAPFGADDQNQWLDEQGPLVPSLIDHIRKKKNDYDVFVFFTYLYYQTVRGISVVREKAIVVPDAHDEPFLRMKLIERVFKMPKALFYNTEDERRLVHKKFYNHDIRSEIGGAGVEVPEVVDANRFKKKYGLDNYIIYVGRIDHGKNCPQLFEDFLKFKETDTTGLKLVLMGKEEVPVPKTTDIISLGFVSEEDKFDGIAGAKLLVLPSIFESLSIVVLEAFSLNVPVLVNGTCAVLKSHCVNSNAGFYYYTTQEFCEMLTYLLEHPKLLESMGQLGYKYVEENYQWHVVIEKLYSLILYVMRQNENGGQ